MLGIEFVKFPPTTYVLRYSSGRIVIQGAGLSFYYFAPTTTLAAVPLGSIEAPFIFEELTQDYQTITIQGQVTYRIIEPVQIAGLLNFTLDNKGRNYSSDDPRKLSQRIVNTVQVLTKNSILALPLREALNSASDIEEKIKTGLKGSAEIQSLGLDVLAFSILAIRPNKDTARALEAETREQILKEADDATYQRRNASVEQERKIKENELNTEIAVENKKRQIREAQMEAEQSIQEKKHILAADEMAFSIQQEEQKKILVETISENHKVEADANAYALGAAMQALNGVDPTVIQALASMNMKPDQIISLAFQGLASKAEKIGEINMSPDLLRELIKKGA